MKLILRILINAIAIWLTSIVDFGFDLTGNWLNLADRSGYIWAGECDHTTDRQTLTLRSTS
jgi:hypothetical protein